MSIKELFGYHMTEHQSFDRVDVVIDTESPWKVTQRDWNWPLYTYKMSASKWQALLARAKRGDPEAEWEVADRYGDGCKNHAGKIVVRRSRRKAAQWFRQAAEHGLSAAQNTLGVVLSNGDGVRKNVDEALSWLRKAFHAGDVVAGQNIAITYREIGDLRTAVKWFRKSADAGDGDALVQLGIHYYWGKGVRKNPKAAVRCFRMASKAKNICEAGRDDAFFLLGVAYSEGEGVRPSIPSARRLFERANVDNDHPAARKMLLQLEA
jgi:TPR repeat protein